MRPAGWWDRHIWHVLFALGLGLTLIGARLMFAALTYP